MLRASRSRSVTVVVLIALLAQLFPVPAAEAQAPATVTLTPMPTPAAGQAGLHLINVFASGVPAGAIDPAAVTVTLTPQPPATAPSAQTAARSIAALTGTSRRVTFLIPASLVVTAATTYQVTLRGSTAAGSQFQSGNASLLVITPPPALASVTPASAFQGTARAVVIEGQFTNFVQGATTAAFGAGIRVGGAPAGVFGPVTVLSPTRAQAQLALDTNAVLGARTVQVRTGTEIVSRANAFTVVGPTVTGLEPALLTVPAGGVGSLTVTIQNPNPAQPMRIALTSADPTVAAVAPEVLLAAGSTTGLVTITGGVAGGPVSITATLNSTSATADVTVRERPSPPVVAEPLSEGATIVGGSGVATASIEVSVNGVVAGVGTIDPGGQFAVVVATPLVDGQIVTATQGFGGLTSLPSTPVTVRARTPAPTLTAPLVAGATEVRGTAVPAAAVNVFADGGPVGTGTALTDGTFSIGVAALVAGQQITATQTVAGQTSVPSAPITVVAVPPPPAVNSPLIEGTTALAGTGTSGATVEAFVEGLSAGTAIAGGAGTWSLVLGTPLAAGQHVTARQTVNGIPSAFAPDVIVQAQPSVPTVNGPLVDGGTSVGGTGVAGALVEVFLDGIAEGTTVAAGNGTWTRQLAAALVAGQRVRARQTVSGIVSAFSNEVIVLARPPAPTVTAPLVEGSTTVLGTGNAGATVAVSINDAGVGTTTVNGSGGWSLVLGAALVAGQRVKARQTVGGIDSVFSPEVIVGAEPPPPAIGQPILDGATSVGGTGLATASVEVFADGVALGTTSVNGNGTWALPLSTPLAGGQVITARQTMAGIPSDLSAPVTVQARLTRIDLTPAPAATVSAGQSVAFSARGTFSNGAVLDPLPGVSWSSDATAVVSISAQGLAVGESAGQAHVRASRDGIDSASTTVTVKPRAPTVTGPIGAGATVVAGDAADPGAAVQLFVNGAARGVAVLANASGQWAVTGLAPALASNDSVTARQTSNGVQSDPSTAVIVTSGVPVLTAINVTPQNLTRASGVNQQYAATGVFSDGSTSALTNGVLWQSTNPSVASITPGGEAITLNAGGTTIVATQGAITGSTGLTVVSATLASIVVTPGTPTILIGQGQTFTATGVLTDGTSQSLSGQVVWASSAPAVAGINPGTGAASGLTAGPSTISATKDGVTGTASLTVQASVSDGTPPTAAITSPVGNALLTARVDVIGTANDANFSKYVLDYATAGSSTFVTIVEGTSPVVNGVLGSFDPTVLINDLYTLRLRVFDRGGNSTSASIIVQVTRDLKVGLFSLLYQDVQVPMAGVPLSLLRIYDSRDKVSGDFGFGWRLDLQSIRLRANRVQGTGWQVNRSGGLFPTYTIVGADQHKISVTLPDGKVEEFDLTITPSSSLLFPLQFVTASYTPRAGSLGTLTILGGNSLFVTGSQPGTVELLDDGLFETFDPTTFQYTAADGTIIVIDKLTGVQSIRDLNGNTLTIGPGGITHSGGRSIVFVRDGFGRITRITDPNGNAHSYVYDQNGDLASYVDPLGSVTRFFYNLSHGLIEIRDPRGLRPARNEYDVDGRLIATIDAAGNRMEYTHNLGASQEVVRDRRGNVTVFSYNAAGLVIAKTDALGHVTSFTHDARGNELTRTDQLGNIWRHTYDARDNVLTDIDPLGRSITRTYNTRGQVLTETDRDGAVTTYTYDGNGNQLTVRDGLGRLTQYTYDARGNRTSTTDANGRVSQFAYDTAGRRTTFTDALGRVTSYTNDANGNRLTDTIATTDGLGGSATLITRRTYDARNRLIADIDPAGGATRFEFNSIGKESAFVDKNGNRVTFEYDARGNRIRSVFQDGTTETMAYDEEGNMTRWTDRGGRVMAYEYDALNHQVRVTYPDGATTSTEYDAVGRIVAQVDERGNRTRYEYDAAGRRIAVIDALNNRTTSAYNGVGKLTSTTDALGRTTAYEYDAMARLTRTVYPDAATTRTTYDTLGRKQSEIDQLGRTRTYEYDAMGRLTAVVDAAGGRTTYTYDEAGNKLTQTDAKGHVTRFAYDGAGRVVRRTLALGMSESFTYDAMGDPLSRTDFRGRVTTYAYNSNNQRTTTTYPDASRILETYTATVRRRTTQDSRGLTTYSYDARDRITQVVHPDASALSYVHDAAGNITSLTAPGGTTGSTYDALNRLTSVTDPQGRTTTYTYDLVGNRSSTTFANGTRTLNTYDALNRLLTTRHESPGGLTLDSYVYTLDAAGRRTSVTEATGRSVTFGYDLLSRLTSETIVDPVLGNSALSYTYDAVGNRLTKTGPTGTVNYTYDANDRLLSEGGITYAYDDNGNQIRKTTAVQATQFAYDFENRLTRVDLPGTSTYAYDADGLRVSANVDGSVTNFLVDANRPLPQVVEERNGAGALVASYVYGSDLISQRRGAATSYYHFDGSGSTRLLSNAAGGTSDTYVYDAFGVQLASTGPTVNRYRFNAQQFDGETGMYYLRARYYSPLIGRFLTLDPVMGNDIDPPSLHQYLYAHADPVNKSDPSGQFALAMSMPSISIPLTISINVAGLLAFLKTALVVIAVAAAATCGLSLAFSTFTAGQGVDPCNVKGKANMFYPGGDTPQTTLHIATAISFGQPAFLRRISPRRVWNYQATPACAGNVAALTGLWCDEYPFATSDRGGPGASTALVPAWEQMLQGGYLSAFYGLCKVTANVAPDDAFAVGPVQFSPQTVWVCKN